MAAFHATCIFALIGTGLFYVVRVCPWQLFTLLTHTLTLIDTGLSIMSYMRAYTACLLACISSDVSVGAQALQPVVWLAHLYCLTS